MSWHPAGSVRRTFGALRSQIWLLVLEPAREWRAGALERAFPPKGTQPQLPGTLSPEEMVVGTLATWNWGPGSRQHWCGLAEAWARAVLWGQRLDSTRSPLDSKPQPHSLDLRVRVASRSPPIPVPRVFSLQAGPAPHTRPV